MANMNYISSPNQASQPRLQETLLRNDDPLVLQQPVFDPQTVEATTGIVGYEYMGEVVVPQQLDANNKISQTVSFEVFRAGSGHETDQLLSMTKPLNHSANHSPATLLKYAVSYNALGSVTVISRADLMRLTVLNGHKPGLQTREELAQEYAERRKLATTVVTTGSIVTFGKSAAGKDIIGPDAEAASSHHFTLSVNEQGVIIVNLSKNGTLVKAAPQPPMNPYA